MNPFKCIARMFNAHAGKAVTHGYANQGDPSKSDLAYQEISYDDVERMFSEFGSLFDEPVGPDRIQDEVDRTLECR